MLRKKYIANFPIRTEKKVYAVGEYVPVEEFTERGLFLNLKANRIKEIRYEATSEVENMPAAEPLKELSEADSIGEITEETEIQEIVEPEPEPEPEEKPKKKGRRKKSAK